MQAGYSVIEQHLADTYTSRPISRLVAEFNNNRFADTLTVAATEHELFPKDSVVGRPRPISGIPYGVVGYARARSENSSQTRFRAVGSECNYKYWRSPNRSTTGGTIFAQIDVEHSQMNANVIRVGFETHGGTARPTNVDVFANIGGTWTLVGDGVAPDGNGVINLYLQNGGTWTTAFNTSNVETNMRGVRVIVRAMNTSGRYCDVIEVASLYSVDLSEEVETFSLDISTEEVSPMNPIGNFSSNSFSATLDNYEYKFSDTLPSAPFYKYIDSEAELYLYTGYNINNIDRYVPQGKYWVDGWNPDEGSASMSVEATDFTRFLRQTDMRDTIFVDKPVSFIVRELLEMNGYNNLSISLSDFDRDYRIPFVWFESGTTVWEAITSVIGADHGQFYVDHDGVIRFNSKRHIYDSDTPDLNITSHTELGNRPNLYSITREWQQTFNRIRVAYETFKENVAFDDKTIINSALWSPSEDLLLRSSPLQFTVNQGSSYNVNIGAEEIEVWPYKGKFNIEGEIFSYNGKWVTDGTTSAIKYNEDQYKTWDYTGDFANIERALEGSQNALHSVSVFTDAMRSHDLNGPRTFNGNMAVEDGRFVISTNPVNSYNTWSTYVRGISADSYQVYGTKLRFPSKGRGRKENIAGLLLHRQTSNGREGYYIELSTTEYAVRRNIGNLRCYKGGQENIQQLMSSGIFSSTSGPPTHFVRPDDSPGGHFVRPDDEPPAAPATPLYGLPATEEGVRGYDIAIDYDQDVELDVVIFTDSNGDQRFSVFVNGLFVTSFLDNTWTQGLFGIFARGSTLAEYEYLYAWSALSPTHFVRPDIDDERQASTIIESARFQDRVDGSYSSGYAAKLRSGANNYFKWFFDEFAPEVHERRDFDVRHNIVPAFSNFVLSTNPLVAIPKTYTTPFRTKFTIENASRNLEVAHGTDTFNELGQSLTSVLNVYGQALVREEQAFEELENKESIRKHGVNEIEVNSPWIQSQEHASDIAEFISDKWGKPLDFASAEIVYDPRLEPGDLVLIDDPEGNFHNKKFHVTGISLSWNDGFDCTLTLRRRH